MYSPDAGLMHESYDNVCSDCAALGMFPTVLHFDPQNQYQNISY